VAAVYRGPDGVAHLKVFFWNNLAGRFAHVDAPQGLQYATGHRNSPGKYLLELPLYLWPWTLLTAAALRRAWRQLRAGRDGARVLGPGAEEIALRPVRFALAAALPSIILLSVAATARNIYLAPALPGFALLLAWWATLESHDRWDVRALRGTAFLLLTAMLLFASAGAVLFAPVAPSAQVGLGASGATVAPVLGAPGALGATAAASTVVSLAIAALGLLAAAVLAIRADAAARRAHTQGAQLALLLAYCLLLIVPAWPLYREVDTWQDLQNIAQAIESDSRGRPLILMAPDETTQAVIDMYTRSDTELVQGPLGADALTDLAKRLAREPDALVVTLLPGRELTGGFRRAAERFHARALVDAPLPAWIAASGLRIAHRYALPNGRRYALLEAPR
jgi:hypothetical protein